MDEQNLPASPTEKKSRRSRLERVQRRVGVKVLERLYNVSLAHSFLYVAIPKAANSTIKAVLQYLEQQRSHALRDYSFGQVRPHDVRGSKLVFSYQLSETMLRRVLFGPGIQRWTLVRDPLSRALSAYLDRFEDARGPLRRQVAEALEASLEDEIPFEDFLRAIKSIPDRRRDIHVASQVRLLAYPTVKYQEILRFEQLPGNVEAHLKQFYPDADIASLMQANRSPKRTNASKSIDEHYTPKARALAAEIYARDRKAFGYDA
jgi:hypothetical protein